MSDALSLGIVIACPIIGAVCALLGGYTRAWQVLFGAIVGMAIADVILKLWSNYIRSPGYLARNPNVVVAWSTDVDWRARLIAYGLLATVALVMGAVVLVVRRFVGSPN